jgi:AAA domain-containing protein
MFSMVHKPEKHDAPTPLATSSCMASSLPLAHTPATRSAEEGPALPQLVSLPALLEQATTEPDWIVSGLLPTGVSLLAGPARIDKPLLANQLGLSVATGVPFLGRFPVCQGRVLYLALAESIVQARGRVVSLLHSQDYPANFDLAFQWLPFRQGGLADLEDTLASLAEPRLVIVDPLEFVQPLRSDPGPGSGYRMRQSNWAENTLAFFLPLSELAARYSLAILLLHHLPEDWPANRRDPLAGLSPTGLTAASACNLLLTPGNTSHACELHIAGVNVAERRLSLAYDGRGGQWRIREE